MDEVSLFLNNIYTSIKPLFRCFELLSLQAMDLEDGCVGPAPYYISHFKVHLENRKCWQREKGYDGPRTSASDGLFTLAEQQADERL